ncbi:ActS/PrrB/RegB family redox-sensitive histidine kinase [Pseudohalocynthiibacter aestuariivivens]|uniref:histidine kinase n=1 Tax=Roseovarius pelagicus TaxID=2980108 RepID=A0ABY6D7J4_9RHOB|nr:MULTISPECIES: ActS/PrrB/RegB family redox-sensitive histidine kinase [Rhodobacterales]QIE46178.1 ActS/PrrB/RegB family redox-sensitive histidine kinase [Pseudohalocynthiibacter aestuariivivens]UXX81859.1 ActS/PrrB/RegB family redox-sensitive histidine kinase [Roseovarius pelagicus]
MTNISSPPIHGRSSGNWIRLRTLIYLRWWAVCGQVAALVIAQRFYGLDFEIGLCYLVIGASVITNLVAAFVFPATKRLSETENLLVVLFDMLQLGLMLYLTGGLNNPFAMLIVGPVIVSASSLSTRSTIFLGLTAIAIVSVLTTYHLPLHTASQVVISMPDLFLFGNWAAIVIAVIFLGVYSRWVVAEMEAMSDAVQATQMALAREQKLTDLGGVVAAAAHELGTPLATIKLTSSELADELPEGSEAREDALLIREQADRCRDILRSMGRAGKDDLHLRSAPLTAVIEEAAEPHTERGKTVLFDHGATNRAILSDQPIILRRPEMIHGLRNLIQNAVDFSQDTVWIESDWSADTVTIRIMDNGKGYPPHLLGRIGDPLMRRRGRGFDPRRPEYEGMGLGLFIAKTLLERSGAVLSFANGSDSFRTDPAFAPRTGAFVEVAWPRAQLMAPSDAGHIGTGENIPFTS